jgi:hypothetical protein
MTHDEGAVLAQADVPTDKTNEITMVRDLLGGLDLTGVVITADALHAQRDHTRPLDRRAARSLAVLPGHRLANSG